MNNNFCQCCGMPMGDTDEMYGLNADGSKNKDYCSYCFKDGKFTFNGSMDELIEFCIPNVTSANKGMTDEQARNMMKSFFPTLKRWKK